MSRRSGETKPSEAKPSRVSGDGSAAAFSRASDSSVSTPD